MRIQIQKKQLFVGLKTAGDAVSNKTTLPVLEQIRIEAVGDLLSLSGTNLEISITKQIPIRQRDAWSEDGGICVPAKLLRDLVETFPEDVIELETLPSCTLTLRCGSSHAEVKGLPLDEFPPLVPFERLGTALKGANLKRLIELTEFCASNDEARPNLHGILLAVREKRLTMFATDGFRLSVAQDAGGYSLPDRVIPVTSVRSLAKLLAAEDEIYYNTPLNDESRAIFTGPDWQLVAQCLDVNMPDYSAIIPKETNLLTRVTIGTGSLRQALKRAGLMAASGVTKLEIQPDSNGTPGTVTVSANAEETGVVETRLDAQVTGNGLAVAYNHQFLEQALEVADAPTVCLAMHDGKNPTRVMARGNDGWSYVIMPMSLH